MIELIICFTTVLFVCLLYKKVNIYRRMPPGPYGLPIVGYYPFMGTNPVETINRLHKKYGEVMSVNWMGETFWILNSYEAVEEAFVTKGEIFAGRPKQYKLSNLVANRIIGNMEGEQWKAMHNFVIGHLSRLGMGKSEFEVTIHNLLDNVDKYIEEKRGEAYDYTTILMNFSFNVITAMIFNKHYDHNDPDFLRTRQWTHEVFKSLPYLNILLTGNIFKLLMKFQPKTVTRFVDNMNYFKNYIQSIVNERMQTFDANNCHDLLDYWLKEIKNPKTKYFELEHVAMNIVGLIMAGSETSSAILYHSLHLMALHPEVQQRVYQEISDTIGTENDFRYKESDRLPYTQAAICEIQRFVLIGAFGNTHVAREETTLRGYRVPKRQKVLANYFALSRDSRNFSNPYEFDVNNFLDENGKFKPNKVLIPFGVGYRKCLGSKLAEVEIFIGFVRLMSKFEWKLCENSESSMPTTMEGTLRFLRPFKVCAFRRH